MTGLGASPGFSHAWHKSPPVALSIAGSDSGGGAGIQADLKTFAAHHVFGVTAITAITAQNTQGVQSIEALSCEIIRAQVLSVSSDFHIRSAKVGMLGTSEIVCEVAELSSIGVLPKLVVDPVMVAGSGDPLVKPDAIAAYRDQLLPLSYLITPNIPEAEALLKEEISTTGEMISAAVELYKLGVKNALVKGGHLENSSESVDILYDGNEIFTFVASRVDTLNTHGSGCTLSAAISANLARGYPLFQSVEKAKFYVTESLKGGSHWALGKGSGPLDHFACVRNHS